MKSRRQCGAYTPGIANKDPIRSHARRLDSFFCYCSSSSLQLQRLDSPTHRFLHCAISHRHSSNPLNLPIHTTFRAFPFCPASNINNHNCLHNLRYKLESAKGEYVPQCIHVEDPDHILSFAAHIDSIFLVCRERFESSTLVRVGRAIRFSWQERKA